jgi:excisionase family DNA binding protein
MQDSILAEVMTVQEVADEYGIKRSTVHWAIKSAVDKLPARKSGDTWLIRREDAEARWGERNEDE